MSSSHPLHSPAPYVVKCCHDLRLFVPDNLVPGNNLRHPLGMATRIVVNLARSCQRRSDALGNGLDMARQVATMAGCRDRTATRMAEYNNQLAMKVFDSIVNRAEDILVDHFVRVADDEKFAKALVEQDFGSHAAIGAAQHHRERLLTIGKLLTVSGILRFSC